MNATDDLSVNKYLLNIASRCQLLCEKAIGYPNLVNVTIPCKKGLNSLNFEYAIQTKRNIHVNDTVTQRVFF